MESMNRPSPELISKCKAYVELVRKGDVSDERAVAHDLVMDSLKENGFTFVDRLDARDLAFVLVQFDEAWQFIEEHTAEIVSYSERIGEVNV